MSARSSQEAGSSSRSALSEGLRQQRESGSSVSQSAPLPHTAVDIPNDDRRSSRPASSGRRASTSGVEASSSYEAPAQDMPYPSPRPLFGSPWPYLVRQNQQLSPVEQGDESPRSARPSRLSWRGRTSLDLNLRRQGSMPPMGEEPSAVEEPLLRDSMDGKRSDRSDFGGAGGQTDASQWGESAHKSGSLLSDVLYGVINAIIAAPAMLSFAAIIFSDKFYAPYIAQLARLAFLSSAIHQAMFTIFSSLSFAVGQVQDVGLIFMSAMATSIAQEGLKTKTPGAEILGTSLVTITVSTLIVGVLIWLLGYFKWANYVQYVPLPTVGGYLGYVGYFCLAAGLGLACDITIDSFGSWRNLLAKDALIKLGPAAGATLVLYLTQHLFRSPLMLPGVLVLIPLLFHAVLLCVGWDLEKAAEFGWVMPAEKGKNFWELYAMFDFKDWQLSSRPLGVVYRQIPELIALFMVVFFGSSLDIAAIQADLPYALDFNHELKTVGVSNIVTGLLGVGFTGSYIFSQTVFSMQAQVKSKVHGFIIAGVEFALFAIPVNVVHYLPKFFFGALLMLFGVEIIASWLFLIYHKLQRIEFCVLWLTYLAIMFTNLEKGIGIGIVLATLYFAFSYARVHVEALTVVPSRSGVVRPLSEREVLDVFMPKLAAFSLSGYIFFGSAVAISNKVMDVAKVLVQHDETMQRQLAEEEPPPASSRGHPLWSMDLRHRTRQAFMAAPRFILLDFRSVHNLDATSAQGLSNIFGQLQQKGVQLLLTNLQPASMRLLEAHGVALNPQPERRGSPTAAARVFKTMEDGVQHCEERFLEIAVEHELCEEQALVMSLEDTLRCHDHIPSMVLGKPIDCDGIAHSLRDFLEEAEFDKDATIFKTDDESGHLYIVEEGKISMQGSFLSLSAAESEVPIPKSLKAPNPDRRVQFGPGTIIGTTDFFLGRPRSFTAVAVQKSRVWLISKAAFNRLSRESPEALIVLLTIIASTSVLNSKDIFEYLERSNAAR